MMSPSDEEIRDRMEVFHEMLQRPLFVWQMSYGRWNNLMIHDPNNASTPACRAAMTQMRNAALEVDKLVREYVKENEPLEIL